MIIPIGEWTLYTACRQTKEWLQRGFSTVVSVNISTTQFVQSNFVKIVEKVLQKTGLEPHHLEIEVTESVTADMEHTVTTLQNLKKLGVQISIDDFGTGFSSLNYLQQFPVDTLKIDQSFVRALQNNPNNETIVKTIISMTHNLNLNVVAEGIETKEQLVFLQQHSCNEGQGYLLSRPVPAYELEEKVDIIESIVGKLGIPQDKNERLWAEELLNMARNELRDTLRLQQGMTLKYKKINGQYIHTLCEGELLYHLGFIPEEIVGKELYDFMPKKIADEKSRYYQRAWEGEENVTYEGELNGIHYLEVFRPVKSGGEVVEVIGSCVDITRQKKVEEALRKNEYKLRLISENMTDLIRISNHDRSLLYVSPSHSEVLGYDTEELKGRRIDQWVHPDDLPALHSAEERMLTTKTASQHQCRMRHRHGYWVPMEIGITPVFGDDGQIEHFVSVSRPAANNGH